MQGLVYKSTGLWYVVYGDDGKYWKARIKGKLKTDTEISSTNPIAVGDIVEFEIEDELQQTAIVFSIKQRDNYIIRISPHNPTMKHIIASNINLVLLIVSVAQPRTSTGFIDRFLITAAAYHIPIIIIINKADLKNKKNEIITQQWVKEYGEIGYIIFSVSAIDEATLLPLKNIIKNKTTLISGHSGVGKSTIINQLIPGLKLKTTEISGWSDKGQHTTTFAEMYNLPDGGKIIDTPGIKEFGLLDIEQAELAHLFPEFMNLEKKCRFNNCLHKNEPGCEIKNSVNKNKISINRYVNYLSILDSIEKKW